MQGVYFGRALRLHPTFESDFYSVSSNFKCKHEAQLLLRDRATRKQDKDC